MHSVLYVLVEASGENEAVEELDEFYGKWLDFDSTYGGSFDYYSLMDESSRVCGASRWTRFQGEPLAMPANSEKGFSWVKRGWNATLNEYEQSLNYLLDELEDRDWEPEDIIDDGLMRYRFQSLAELGQTDVHLYDATQELDPLITSSEEWEEIKEPSYRQGLWVVPIDVHY